MEQDFNLHGEACEEVVGHVVQRILHPLFLVLAQLVVAYAVWVIDVVEHSMDADMDLSEKFVGPYLLEIETKSHFSGLRVVHLEFWNHLVSVCTGWEVIGLVLFAVVAGLGGGLLLGHQTVEEAMVHEILSILHLSIVFVIKFYLAHRGLNVGD